MSDHHHDHSSEKLNQSIPFRDKAHKLIDHWVKHNDEHARSYRQWADAFRQQGLESAAALLTSAAELSRQINHTLAAASHLVDSPDSAGSSNGCPVESTIQPFSDSSNEADRTVGNR